MRDPYPTSKYMVGYLVFMGVLCVLPYTEENLRCLRVWLKDRKVAG